MNHALIKKILKFLSMMAFVGIIGYQLYNIIVNGGSKTEKDNSDDEVEPVQENNDGYPENIPTSTYNELKGQMPKSSKSYQ